MVAPVKSTSAAEPLNWLEMSQMQPRLCTHIEFHAQDYRGQRWYVLHDRLSGRHTRINAIAYNFIARLNGVLSVGEILEISNDASSTVLTESEASLLIVQLQHMGALAKGQARSGDDLSDEHLQRHRTLRVRRWSTPLAIRIPMFDPDELLDRMMRYRKFLSARWAWGAWLLLITIAAIVGVAHADPLAQEFSTVFTSSRYFLLIWLVYPLLKTVHEFSHALCLKRTGGEVHEMGITLLLLTPVPYVDASAAWVLRSRYQRALVSAAGIIAEITVAAVALLLWVLVEPGAFRDMMFAFLIVGSFSTILFNANPLLKFDGYYVLQDLVEIPNLYARAQRYYIYLFKRYFLSVKDARTSVLVAGEQSWFVLYGALAFVYRSIIMLSISLWLIGQFMVVGVLLTLWVITQQFVRPLVNGLRYLSVSVELENRRLHSAAILGLLVIPLGLALALMPITYSTRAEGVVWVPAQAEIFASSAGQVAEVFATPGSSVSPGDLVLRLLNPDIEAQVRVLEARLRGYEVQQAAERVTRSDQMLLTAEDIVVVKSELADYQRQLDKLTVRASSSGTFTISGDTLLIGRYFDQGDLIGHVVNPAQLVVRVVVPENQVGPLRSGVTDSRVRLAERFDDVIPAVLVRETPSANNRLPTAALGTSGGGGIAIAFNDKKGLETVDRVFHLELALPDDVQVSGLGERAYVKLRHPSRPLASRWMDAARQLFLRRLPGYTT